MLNSREQEGSIFINLLQNSQVLKGCPLTRAWQGVCGNCTVETKSLKC